MLLLNYVIYPGLKVTAIYLIYKLVAFLILRIRFARHYIKFPYEPSHWLLGDLLKVAPRFPFTDREVIADGVRKYVNRNHLRANKRHDLSIIWMSWFPIVVAASHKSFEAIYQTEIKKHYTIYSFLGLRDGLVCSGGAKWKSRRKMIEPLFSTKQLSQFAPVMRSIVDSTVDSLSEVTGKPVVLSNYIHSLTMDAIFETGFKLAAHDFKDEKNRLINAIEKFEDRLMLRIINPLYWNDWLFSKFDIGKELNELSAQGDDHFNFFLDKRFGIKSNQNYSKLQLKNNNKERDDIFLDRPYRDMLDLMASKKDQIDRAGMIEEILTMISAGHETIANALSWLICILGNNPLIQDRLVEEIESQISSDEDVDDLNKINQMVYMEQCIKESLRLFPPLPVVLRHIEKDVHVGDKTILKDSVVVMFILSTHHDPEIYPDPFKYDPQRFSPENVDKIPKYSFIPFGLGPRMCIGYRYAYIEMKIFLIQFLRRFRVESVKSMEQIDYYIELITRPTCPLEVIISPRD